MAGTDTTGMERVLMGWVGFVYVEEGYSASREFRKMEYITTADSCYLSRVDKNKGNELTDKTKWVCIASGAAATAAATQCLERINELNRLLVQLSAAITDVEDASGVTADTRAALADLTSRLSEVDEMKRTLNALLDDVYSATDAANEAYRIASQIDGVDVMKGKPASMAIFVDDSVPVGVDVRIRVAIKPDTANQSVVFIPVGGAQVSPDGVVKSPAAEGDVSVYVVSTEESGVWSLVTIHYRAVSALTQDDGTALTQDDGTGLEV